MCFHSEGVILESRGTERAKEEQSSIYVSMCVCMNVCT